MSLAQYIEKNTVDKKNLAALNKYKKNQNLLENMRDQLDSKQCKHIMQQMSGSFLKSLSKTSRLPETKCSDPDILERKNKCRTSI